MPTSGQTNQPASRILCDALPNGSVTRFRREQRPDGTTTDYDLSTGALYVVQGVASDCESLAPCGTGTCYDEPVQALIPPTTQPVTLTWTNSGFAPYTLTISSADGTFLDNLFGCVNADPEFSAFAIAVNGVNPLEPYLPPIPGVPALIGSNWCNQVVSQPGGAGTDVVLDIAACALCDPPCDQPANPGGPAIGTYIEALCAAYAAFELDQATNTFTIPTAEVVGVCVTWGEPGPLQFAQLMKLCGIDTADCGAVDEDCDILNPPVTLPGINLTNGETLTVTQVGTTWTVDFNNLLPAMCNALSFCIQNNDPNKTLNMQVSDGGGNSINVSLVPYLFQAAFGGSITPNCGANQFTFSFDTALDFPNNNDACDTTRDSMQGQTVSGGGNDFLTWITTFGNGSVVPILSLSDYTITCNAGALIPTNAQVGTPSLPVCVSGTITTAPEPVNLITRIERTGNFTTDTPFRAVAITAISADVTVSTGSTPVLLPQGFSWAIDSDEGESYPFPVVAAGTDFIVTVVREQ